MDPAARQAAVATQRDAYGNAAAPAAGAVEGDEAGLDNTSKLVFTNYVCRSLNRGKPHPGDIAEAASLGCGELCGGGGGGAAEHGGGGRAGHGRERGGRVGGGSVLDLRKSLVNAPGSHQGEGLGCTLCVFATQVH